MPTFHDKLIEALDDLMPYHDLTEDPEAILVFDNVILIQRSEDEPPFTEYDDG